MKLIQVEFSKEKILEMGEEERLFFIALGHFMNEINVATKYLFWAANAPSETIEELDGKYSMMLFHIRFLAGALNETWELFQNHFLSAKFSQKYVPEINQDSKAKDAYKNYRSYFSRTNPINLIRKRYAFHFSAQDAEGALAKYDGPLLAYLERGIPPNNLYHFVDALIGTAILDATNRSDLDELVNELFKVSVWFIEIADVIMKLILVDHSSDIRAKAPREVHFENLPNFGEERICWFTDTSDWTNPASSKEVSD